MGKGQDLYTHGKTRIPGGTQLLSKRPEMFLPDLWPSYYQKAKGVEVWDLDGTKYIDMSHNAIGACLLGAADPDVNAAVMNAIENGSASTLNCPEEVELADLLCELHPWAQMVRYVRGGGEAMVVAARLARASTKREKIAFCGYHGWHDWYLAANLGEESALDGHLLPGLDPSGVPRGLKGTMLPFRYNKIEELEAIVKEHGTQLAAIVMEPIRDADPSPNFLAKVRELADKVGAVLVFDEVSAGFRLNCGGSHLVIGDVRPDIAVFAKAMSNGFPMGAIVGTAKVMTAAQTTFISSTSWTERVGPVAALATIKKHRKHKVHEHVIRLGTMVQDGWVAAGKKAGIKVHASGIKPLTHLAFDDDSDQLAKTLYTQLMLKKGFLAGGTFYPTFAHNDSHVAAYLKALDEVFAVIADGQKKGDLRSKLEGPPAHVGFRRLT
jgi:glutamate-1-semialdehyde 2,1-aminomutase